jgi:alkanesulfonate monooxygenase SsuD/methylene tetrahydromethanopterin reductase-like flavin-dependent oxidoreductase (luciferase family)
MRLAVRHADCWVTTGDRSGATAVPAEAGAAIVRAQVARLEAECAEAGRDPRRLRRMVLSGAELDAGLASRDAFEDTLGRYAEAGVTDFVVHWPRASQPYAGDVAHFERVVGS